MITPTISDDGLLVWGEPFDSSKIVVVEDGPIKGMAFLPPLPTIDPDGRIWYDDPR